jgi:hypothetical protein
VRAIDSSSKSDAGSEQVQVVRIEVIGIAEALARLAAARPAVLDAREAAIVERDRARRRVATPDDGVVLDDQHDEHHGGERDPPRRRPPRQATAASSTAAAKTARRA